MIPFGSSNITSEQEFEDLKSRMIWQTERRKSLLFPKSKNYNADTSKPLVGKVGDEFIVTRVGPSYSFLFPQIFAKVKIDDMLTQRRISIYYRLGFWTSLFFIQIILTTAFILYDFLFSEMNVDSMLDNLIYLLMYPGISFLIASLEAIKLKETIMNVLEK